jgi:hypothetical protein
MAIEDAVELARQLGRPGTVADGLARFDAARRDRAGKMARTAAANRDAKTAGPVAAAFRNLIMPVMFGRFYERATGWLYDYDPGSHRPRGSPPAWGRRVTGSHETRRRTHQTQNPARASARAR